MIDRLAFRPGADRAEGRTGGITVIGIEIVRARQPDDAFHRALCHDAGLDHPAFFQRDLCDVVRACRMARDDDALRVAAEFADVLRDPGQHARRVFQHGGVAAAFAEPVAAQHHDIALGRDIAGDKAIIVGIAVRPAAAVHENEDRQRCFARIGAVDQQLLARIGAEAGTVSERDPALLAGDTVDCIEHGRAVAVDGDQHRSACDEADADQRCDHEHDSPHALSVRALPTDLTMFLASVSSRSPMEARNLRPSS